MAIRTVVTKGYGNGTFAGTITDVVLRGYAVGEAIAEVEEIFSGGYFPEVYKYRPRVRYKFKDEKQRKAAKIVEEIIEAAPEDTTQRELEAVLRATLKTQGLLYKALYLTWIKQENEQKRRILRRRRDEEVIMLIAKHLIN